MKKRKKASKISDIPKMYPIYIVKRLQQWSSLSVDGRPAALLGCSSIGYMTVFASRVEAEKWAGHDDIMEARTVTQKEAT